MDTSWMDRQPAQPAVELETGKAHPARLYDYFLGGKTNYPADRAAAEAMLTGGLPTARRDARASRDFMIRAATYMVDQGVRQFLDIGTGIPTSPNLHEVAQSRSPESRVVYTDNDPIVLAHSRALHTSSPEGRAVYLPADAEDPDTILGSEALRDTLDLSRPVGLTLLLLLHWLPADAGSRLVRRLMNELAPGSHLVVSYLARDLFDNEGDAAALEGTFANGSTNKLQGATRPEVEALFDGLEMVEPGLVPTNQWRPTLVPVQVGDPALAAKGVVPAWSGIGVKR
ncbi:SAM-dependent methyltransferase [Streptomyces sp. NBC_01497]|uniref:SAM-dependent methyltransferase n=1 Tax=Streptomyces sp. NBC_01497 TaxID=2903885 RepID=UPI002E2F0A9D|nr:SAM-dependent methyltransferase [Streptomyces sp. NBC_01497]